MSISGTVFSLDTNQPLNGIVVEAVAASATTSPSVLGGNRDPPLLTVANNNGMFTFKNLDPGSYHIRCHVPGGFVDHSNEVVVENSENVSARPPQSIEFQLAPFKKGVWRE